MNGMIKADGAFNWRAQLEPDYLTESDVLDRIEQFRSGPVTTAHAADCGLLALAVPTRFGGLYISRIRQGRVEQYMARYPNPIQLIEKANVIALHLTACCQIIDFGSCIQHDFYLPQLASGKRVAFETGFCRMVHVHRERDGIILRGEGFSPFPMEPRQLLVVDAQFERRQRKFVIPSESLSGIRKTHRGALMWWIDRYIVPSEALLDNENTQLVSTEKWEAIWWRTDRSAS